MLYIISLYNFNSLMWLKGLVEVVSTCSRDDMLDNVYSLNNESNQATTWSPLVLAALVR